MAIPIHTIQVRSRPAVGGNTFIKRYPVFNYQHTIVNQGWFDTASCDIMVRSQSEAQQIATSYIGCFAQFFVDNPLVPIWEGFINRIIFNAGLSSYTVSLDEMANRMTVVYTGAANAAAETAAVNNTPSQALYGIKQDQIEFGVDPSAGTMRTTLQQTQIAQRAFPQTSVSQAQGQSNIVRFELLGIFHTLEWEKFFTGVTAATVAMGTAIQNTLAAMANGTTFFDNADVSQVSANAVTMPAQTRAMSYWERMLKIAEAGDGTNYWIVGVMPTDPNTKTRRFYYRSMNTNTDYIAYQKDGLKPRNLYGKVIPPWAVAPDTGIRVDDLVTGFGLGGNDPRVTYIQSVQYDANSQIVQWAGADDTSARAFFQMKKGFKPLSRNSPGTAPQRTIST